uniref:Uncharacterized protein n=1 Tax=Arundo donax TaxID=35708 RepID=A0A0A9BFY2_ARUDO
MRASSTRTCSSFASSIARFISSAARRSDWISTADATMSLSALAFDSAADFTSSRSLRSSCLARSSSRTTPAYSAASRSSGEFDASAVTFLLAHNAWSSDLRDVAWALVSTIWRSSSFAMARAFDSSDSARALSLSTAALRSFSLSMPDFASCLISEGKISCAGTFLALFFSGFLPPMLSPKMLLVALTEPLRPRTSSMAASNQHQKMQPNKKKNPRNKKELHQGQKVLQNFLEVFGCSKGEGAKQSTVSV